MRLQPIYDIAEICARHGISQAIVCPGSRCAPLTLAFARHEKISCRTLSDERSAGFVALGIAQQTKTPAVLVSTSGSAAYNFSPAVAEAFFQQIPVLIFTADRPKEWIDQLDGQTIRQENLFGNHVKKSYTLPADYTHADAIWYIHRTVNEAIALAQEFPQGPVHINIPLREPLYPAAGEKISFTKNIRITQAAGGKIVLSEKELKPLLTELTGYQKVMLVAGQNDYHEGLLKAVEKFIKIHKVALLGDVISNFHSLSTNIPLAEIFLGQCSESVAQSLQPDLLITFGKSVISKNLKVFLRKNPSLHHWHIQPGGLSSDTFQALTRIIYAEPKLFFESLSTPPHLDKFELQKKDNYANLWKAEMHRAQLASLAFFSKSGFNELTGIREIINALPERCNLHLANSMAVRYANLIGLAEKGNGVRVFSNRGTSGIDGCTSTAVGHALSSDVPNILITGDLAFFYDRNAFWHNYPIPNLHVVVVNNHGGVIFNLIDGPGDLPEANEFFITRQRLSARHLAHEFGFQFQEADNLKQLKSSFKDFFKFDGPTRILEITTDQASSKESFNQFKNHIKSSYES
ncbi:MAG: 2-succinyl-5-enolpyruvyl-6-hydroxy-3-cyclohexene-1-carboxylic-acid synthase [Cyclobacteriaceae bacterium]|nr:2-succinyl-5-enolpyruvyl-6-hydroxy-3-cyclohexene-1-carboxylic-acid synthase [Cyclobacteriaceae bacterium]